MIRIANLTCPLPRVLDLTAVEVDSYWQELTELGLRQVYGTHPVRGPMECQYGTSIEIPRAMADYLTGALRAVDRYVKEAIDACGGLESWMRGREPSFAGAPIRSKPAHDPFSTPWASGRIAGEGEGLLPMSVDFIVCEGQDGPSLSVVELQSGYDYLDILWRQHAALGRGRWSPRTWHGAIAPNEAIANLLIGRGRESSISVLGNFPSTTGNLIDEAGWAAALSDDGTARGFFLATDLRRDDQGWYHEEYELNPVTGLPRLDSADQPMRESPPRMRRIDSVVTMQTQKELDEIYVRLEPQQRELFAEFVADTESIDWLLPLEDWYVADKSLLPNLHHWLADAASPYAEAFIPAFGSPEIVTGPGAFVRKPIRGVGGADITQIELGVGERCEVPDGWILQQHIEPYEFPLALPNELAGAFLPPSTSPSDSRKTTGTVEIRVSCVPGSTTDADSYVFLARVAPTWDPIDGRHGRHVLTNQAYLQRALWNSPSVSEANHRYAPFGWFAVTVAS